LACPSLEALLRAADFSVRAVVTQPDKPKGRDLKVQPGPIKKIALAHNLPVLQPARAREETFVSQLRQLAPDLIVVVAYGQILPQRILDIPRLGCLNVHTSLLPKHRGAAPIQWAIFNGDAETGVGIMKMDAGLDTGDIVNETRTPIADTDNAQTLHDRLAKLGADLLVRTLPDYIAGRITTRPQPGQGASYARKITKEDGRIDWSRPARDIWNQIRAFTPWPGAFTYLVNTPLQRGVGERSQTPTASAVLPVPGPTQKNDHTNDNPQARLLKIWNATVHEGPITPAPPGEVLEAGKAGIVVACGKQALRILEVQLEGGRRMTVEKFLAGHPVSSGSRF
jgi:methionyl-tRNA formyltransferase